MDNSVPKNVNWRINQCKETFCSLVFISPFCSVNVPQQSQKRDAFKNILLKISDLAVFPHEN